MRPGPWLTHILVLVSVTACAAPRNASPGKNSVVVRGQAQDVYYYPERTGGRSPRGVVLFAPGDGGWRGFAVTIAETLASWGYDVYGIDTKRYLESFTGKTTLKESEVPSDFRQLGEWARDARFQGGVHLLGWSEGAGLGAIAAAAEQSKKVFSGLICLGLPEYAVLGWRWTDNVTYVTRKPPNEPMVQTVPYLAKVAPLPLVMIHASQDEYTNVDAAKKLFGAAREPKRFEVVQAQNHRFEGGRDQFFRILYEGLEWISRGAK